MAHSTKPATTRKPNKPDKPTPNFPLFPHDSGRWAKKIRGQLHDFGRWATTQNGELVQVKNVAASAKAAQKLDNKQRDDLHASRTPRADKAGLTVSNLVNHFLNAKRRMLANGELADRSFLDYHRNCTQVVSAFGANRVRMSRHENPAERSAKDAIAGEFSKLLKAIDVNGRRGFYAIRHTFQTIGEESRDFPAVRSIMGHVASSMSGAYRERISDVRLQAVVNTVRAWLWPQAESQTADAQAATA